jgi:hypothetical protein
LKPLTTQNHKGVLVNNEEDSGASGESADGPPLPQLEPSNAVKKRCKGVTKRGTPCTAWAMQGGLCYFHANPDKPAELGRNGGQRNKHSYEQSTEHIAPPESAADVKRMLAETMAEVKAGKMDPKVANTVAYVGTALLRAYETDAARVPEVPAQSYVPLIYRSLTKDHEPTEIYDYQTGKLIAPKPSELPSPASAPATTVGAQLDEEVIVEILDY